MEAAYDDKVILIHVNSQGRDYFLFVIVIVSHIITTAITYNCCPIKFTI